MLLETRILVYQQDFESIDLQEMLRRWEYFASAAKEVANLVEEAIYTGEFYRLTKEEQKIANNICQFFYNNCILVD